MSERRDTTGLTAIILAAGVGKRFGELVDHPKAMLSVAGESLLGRLTRQLSDAGVARIVVVVGHAAERIERARATMREVTLVHNPDYRRGAILSLWTAREFLSGSALIMDADVYVPDEMIARLIRSPHESCFLLDGRVEPTGEEQMLMARGDRVVDIARVPRGDYDLSGESVGFFKVSREAAELLRELLAAHVARGDVDIEHEEVYPELLARVPVGFERVDDLEWTEIDFPADLERARYIACPDGGG